MKILYLHGWQSVPGGVKPSYLKQAGHQLLEPALPDEDFDAAVRIAESWLAENGADLILGSSRGGAIAINMQAGEVPRLLLCPAWKRWGTIDRVPSGTIILHAPADEVVPFSDSEALLTQSGLSASALIAVGSEHRLADPDSLAMLLKVVNSFAMA